MFNTSICTLQSTEVVLLNRHNIDPWILFFLERKTGVRCILKKLHV